MLCPALWIGLIFNNTNLTFDLNSDYYSLFNRAVHILYVISLYIFMAYIYQ